MKIAKVTLPLLLLLNYVTVSKSVSAGDFYSYTDNEDEGSRAASSPAGSAFAEASVLIHRLFDPIERGFTETRLFHMRDAVAQRVASGEAFNVTFMDELKKFLFGEMRMTVINVVKKMKLVDINVNACAHALVQKLVVEGTKEKYGIDDVFGKDPHTLPPFVFTYCTNCYVEPVIIQVGHLPVVIRDTVLLREWATLVYQGLGYIEEFCKSGRTALEVLGVSQL